MLVTGRSWSSLKIWRSSRNMRRVNSTRILSRLRRVSRSVFRGDRIFRRRPGGFVGVILAGIYANPLARGVGRHDKDLPVGVVLLSSLSRVEVRGTEGRGGLIPPSLGRRAYLYP